MVKQEIIRELFRFSTTLLSILLPIMFIVATLFRNAKRMKLENNPDATKYRILHWIIFVFLVLVFFVVILSFQYLNEGGSDALYNVLVGMFYIEVTFILGAGIISLVIK